MDKQQLNNQIGEEFEHENEVDGLDQQDVEDYMELDANVNPGDEGFPGQSEEGGPQNQIVFEDDSIQGFFNHKEPVFSVAIHPFQQNLVATGGGDDKAYLWDITNGEMLLMLEGHKDSVICVEFSVNGKYLATGGMDGLIQVFSIETGALVCQLVGPDEITWMRWHPKGSVILAGSQDSTVWMFQVPSGNVMNVFAGHTGAVTCGTFTNNGKRIVSGSEDGGLIIFDPVTTEAQLRLTPEDGRFHQEVITCLAIHPEDGLMITGSSDNTARLINLNTGEIIGALQNHTESIESVVFCEVLPLVATGSVDGSINIWDIQTLRLRNTLKHEDAVTKIQFLPHSPTLISSSMDQTIKVWDVRTGECLKVFKGHTDTILNFEITKDGQKIVTTSDDGCALVFGL